MEEQEYDYKLGRNDPVLITQAISKLVDKIKDKIKNKLYHKVNKIPELKYLKSKCCVQNEVVSLSASKGIITLVEWGILEINLTISDFISFLPHAESYLGITKSICELLVLDMERKVATTHSFKCPYNICTPQHPIITIIKQNQGALALLVNEIKFCYRRQERLSYYMNELFYPVYFYILCDYDSKLPEVHRKNLWNCLINCNGEQSLDVAIVIVGWLQITSKRHLVESSSFIIELTNAELAFRKNSDAIEVLFLWLGSLIYEEIRHSCDPHNEIHCLTDVIKKQGNIKTSSCLLLMLADSILICPAPYLRNMLCLCYLIIQTQTTTAFAAQSIKASVLPWIANASVLTVDAIKIANKILVHIENNKFKQSCNLSKAATSNIFLRFLKSTNEHANMAIKLCILSETFSNKNCLIWLSRVKTIPSLYLKYLRSFLQVLLCCEDFSSEVTLITLEILLNISTAYPEATTQLLILILYKLANTSNPELHLKLLRALPKMAVLKENLALILNTLESIKRLPSMQCFTLSLYYDLWNVEVKSYPYLQSLLMVELAGDSVEKWKVYTTRAHILKEICLKRPELYGQELVVYLSKVLNVSGYDEAMATSLALQGITALCKAGIVDIHSTWQQLEPRFSKETRIPVVQSWCDLIGVVPNLVTENDDLLNTVVSVLWEYTAVGNKEVSCIAYKTLEGFSLQQLTPSFPKDINVDFGKILNAELCDHLNIVAGSCWINLLESANPLVLNEATNLCIKLISDEVENYHKGTYVVASGRKEPQNFDYLPIQSLVRAVGNYLKRHVLHWQNSSTKAVYLHCLRIFSQEYVKPLPPADWCFLQELVHTTESKPYCISIASHQVQLSGTARRFMENYIIALTNTINNDEDIVSIYKNLKYLGNSIQPVILRPFIEKTARLALDRAKTENECGSVLFEIIVENLQQTLNKEDLQDANRSVLSEVIVDLVLHVDADHVLFDVLLKCIVVIPKSFIAELSSLELWTQANNKISTRIRCALSVTADSTLSWLNDCISAASLFPTDYDYVLNKIAEVIRSYVGKENVTGHWIMQLLQQIQATLSNDKCEASELLFMCDVYILSCVLLASHDLLRVAFNGGETQACRLELFPQSLACIMKNEHWNRHLSQMCEWLHYMTKCEIVPRAYQQTFYQTLTALRHTTLFKEQQRCMKYLDSRIPFDSINH